MTEKEIKQKELPKDKFTEGADRIFIPFIGGFLGGSGGFMIGIIPDLVTNSTGQIVIETTIVGASVGTWIISKADQRKMELLYPGKTTRVEQTLENWVNFLMTVKMPRLEYPRGYLKLKF